MKKMFLGLAVAAIGVLQGMEYEVQVDNEMMRVTKWKLMANEAVGLHRDELPRVIFSTTGGTITRIEEDGTTNDVVLPSHTAVYLDADPVGKLHKAVNAGDTPIEAVSIEYKIRK